jgi:hypothetical protein
VSVSLAASVGAFYQSFLPAGNPNSGGTIDTFLTNTNTPQATFTSASGATPNSNPIQLGADGRVPSEIYCTDGIAYTFVLKDALGNTLKTQNDIVGIGSIGAALSTALAAPTGGDLVSFLQAGTAAQARTSLSKEQDILSLFDWLTPTQIASVRSGAAPDVTAAFQALLNYLGTVAVYPWGASIYVPRGRYAISAPITVPENLTQFNLQGDGMFATRFEIAAGVIMFIGVPLHSVVNSLHWSDIGFFGGAGVTFFGTRNVDRSMWNFDFCQFRDQTVTSIDMFAAPGASSLDAQAYRCLFWGAQKMVNATCDYFMVRDCWAEIATPGAVFSGAQTFNIEGLTGVPFGGAGATACWLESSAHCTLRRNRFGSEDGHGRTVLHQLTAGSATTVRIENNFAPTDDYAYKFDAAPEFLSIKTNDGYSLLGGAGCKGIKFSTASALSASKVFMERGKWEFDDFDPTGTQFSNDGSAQSSPMQELAYAKVMNTLLLPGRSSNVLYADMVVQAGSVAAFTDGGHTNSTLGTGAYPLLGALVSTKITATAEGATAIQTGFGIASGLAADAGVMTAVFDFYITGATHPFESIMYVQGNYRHQDIHNGFNIVCYQIQPDSGAPAWTATFNFIPNGCVILFGRCRIFKGTKNIDTIETIYSDLTAGVVPNVRHETGDKVLYCDAAAAAAPGKVCVTAGTPGTFKNMAILAA